MIDLKWPGALCIAVITAGTAIREAIDIIRTAGGEPMGVVLALDRQEKGKGDQSAVQEVGGPVCSLVGGAFRPISDRALIRGMLGLVDEPHSPRGCRCGRRWAWK
jgi:hypothetical protein